jgi:hypothetical protein
VYELIEEGFVNETEKEYKFNRSLNIPEGKTDQIYHFKTSDQNIYRLSQKFPNIDYKDIMRANPNLDPNNLREGDKIIIPEQKKRYTLTDIARDRNKSREYLKKINPAIIDPDKEIPSGYEVRL